MAKDKNPATSFLNRAFGNIRNLSKSLINTTEPAVMKGFDMEKMVDMKNFVKNREEYIYNNFNLSQQPSSWDAMYKNDIKKSLKIYKDTINIDFTRHIRYLDYDMMELMTPAVGTALNIYADYIVQKDPRTGNFINVVPEFSQIDIVQDQLDDLQLEVNILADRWGINDDQFLHGCVRDVLKYGDLYLWLVLEYREDDNGELIPVGIKDIQKVLPYAVSILTDPNNFNAVQGYHYKPESMRTLYNRHMASGGMYTGEVAVFPKDTEHSADAGAVEQVLTPLEMVHLSINKGVYAPYGTSLLEGGRKTWKQLLMLEDADVYWSLRQGQSRKIYYIDTGRLPPNKAEEYVRKIRTLFRKKPYTEPQGDWNDPSNFAFNMLSTDEDLWIPLPKDSQTKIEQLPAQTNEGTKESIKRLEDKLFSKLQVPKAFLTYESDINAKATLLTEDSAFAKTIYRYQSLFSSMFWEPFVLQFYLMDDLEKVVGVRGAIMSTDTKVEKEFLENFETRINIAQQALGLTDPETQVLIVPRDYIMSKILDLPAQEIAQVQKDIDKARDKNKQDTDLIDTDKPSDSSRSKVSFAGSKGGRPSISPSLPDEPDTAEEPSTAENEFTASEGPTPGAPTAPEVPEEVPAFEAVSIVKNKESRKLLLEKYAKYEKHTKDKLKQQLMEKENSIVNIFVNSKPLSAI